ncbi:MAG: tetraacyldisaccharide 4'-kinase, partial [Magnetococcus sp. YQC-5]
LARSAMATLEGVGHLYGAILALRAWCYRNHLFAIYRAPCPVISVGNLTTGGTGKTPMVLWLARQIQQTGRRVAIVSRGYRQRSRSPITVVADPFGIRTTPPLAADEAWLLASALPGTTVLTGSNRPVLMRHAIERFQCDCILMDDGFQRLDVRKDLDLVLLDAQRPFGNGRPFPGGLLREMPSALSRCDAIVLTRADHPQTTDETLVYLRHHFPDKPVMTAIHRPSGWIPLHTPAQPMPLHAMTEPVVAFCGIATPESFLRTLQSLDVTIVAFYPFPDHHFFSTEEIHQLMAKNAGARVLVCTEKDAVKLDPEKISWPIFALRVEMSFQSDPEWLNKRIHELNAN